MNFSITIYIRIGNAQSYLKVLRMKRRRKGGEGKEEQISLEGERMTSPEFVITERRLIGAALD